MHQGSGGVRARAPSNRAVLLEFMGLAHAASCNLIMSELLYCHLVVDGVRDLGTHVELLVTGILRECALRLEGTGLDAVVRR